MALKIKMSKTFRDTPLEVCSGLFIWDIEDEHGPIESHSSLENAVRARGDAEVDPDDYIRYLKKLHALVNPKVQWPDLLPIERDPSIKCPYNHGFGAVDAPDSEQEPCPICGDLGTRDNGGKPRKCPEAKS